MTSQKKPTRAGWVLVVQWQHYGAEYKAVLSDPESGYFKMVEFA
jgi:hypothetical protein